jgi:hypothetical protein
MKITVTGFKNFTDMHSRKCGVRWYGDIMIQSLEYQNPRYHEGIALVAYTAYGMAKFVSAMDEHGFELGEWDYHDGDFYSWGKHRFYNDSVKEKLIIRGLYDSLNKGVDRIKWINNGSWYTDEARKKWKDWHGRFIEILTEVEIFVDDYEVDKEDLCDEKI